MKTLASSQSQSSIAANKAWAGVGRAPGAGRGPVCQCVGSAKPRRGLDGCSRFSMQGRHRGQLPVTRHGFTIVEMLVSMMLGGIVGIAIITITMATFRTWQTEARQNEVDWRVRQQLNDISYDANQAVKIYYAGSNPSASQQVDPNGSGGKFGVADQLIIFQLPSYDANNIIANKYDYVGYGWVAPNHPNQNTPSTTGVLTRTSFPATGSSRSSGSSTGTGGMYISTFNVQLHVAATSTSTNKNTWFNPFPSLPSGYTLASDVQKSDEIFIDTSSAIDAWGTHLSGSLQFSMKLRNMVPS